MLGRDTMKIEKVNDHQIRCTLTKADLADRELKISELAYGTEKAKDLFRDMMQQASFQFGFEAEDIPLMIEAIPLNSDCIVLIITKVEDPEELDTRFSNFAPSVHEGDSKGDLAGLDEMITNLSNGADDVLDLFKKIKDGNYSKTEKALTGNTALPGSTKQRSLRTNKTATLANTMDLTKIYCFDSLHGIIQLSHALNGYYTGVNSVYKNPISNKYYLVVSKSSHSPEEFNRVCNIISEYGLSLKYSAASEAFFEEHSYVILKNSAIQTLCQM